MSVEKLQSFFAGVITGIKPDLLPEFASPSGQNAVIDRIAEKQGRVRRRKGAVPRTCAPITGSPEVLGIFHYPANEKDQILVIAADGTLNVEGDYEFVCPPPEIITPAVRSMLKFFTLEATASTITGLTAMATASSAHWSARNQSAAVGEAGAPFCVGGVFGTQFNAGGVIEDYFAGATHSHNLSDENTVEVAASVGYGGSYGVKTVTGTSIGWVKWVPATPYQTNAIGWSIKHKFSSDALTYALGSPISDFHSILESEWGGADIQISTLSGFEEGGIRLGISFMDADNDYYSTGSETDWFPVADTWYTISVSVSYSSKVGGVVQADGSVQVSIDGVPFVQANNVKIETQMKTDSGGENRIPAIYFSVIDHIDDICISPLT